MRQQSSSSLVRHITPVLPILKALWQDLFATTSNESEISRATEPVWPTWTDLIIAPKGLKLTDQLIELQFVIRRAMAIVEERFIFEDSFPGLIMRNGWNRRAIQQSCEKMAPVATILNHQLL